jgi:hypothetical protein
LDTIATTAVSSVNDELLKVLNIKGRRVWRAGWAVRRQVVIFRCLAVLHRLAKGVKVDLLLYHLMPLLLLVHELKSHKWLVLSDVSYLNYPLILHNRI